ncbi:MAG TPA: TIGR00725 family protein [Candidatus Omnitrophica bacterium]|nr:TIGR00725 family protein [Candidatus Omnitrophota bacterium]
MINPRIGVIGGSIADKSILNIAEIVGNLVASRGGIIVCGGMGGVMEAVCKGAKRAGGKTIGILPTRSVYDANPYIDIPIVTGLGEARNLLVVLNSDVIIAIDGAYGTLTEIAFALLYKKPIVALKSWELVYDGEQDKNVIYVSTPEEAVNKVFELLTE